MNKTVTINLAGLVFYIEEEAYDVLKNYLSAIKNHFKNEEGCDEIVADIESRLAELLKAKTNEGKQVLLSSDINEAIAIMGMPEDFADVASDNNEQTSHETKHTYQSKTRRVFRDGDNKMVGGVCSGIASYFNVDPLWIRLALIVMFFGFGSGFLLYIILWIIIPEAKTTAEKLEMRGEPIDINTISKTIKDEAEQLKTRAESFGKGVKNEYNYHRSNSAGNRFANFIRSVFYGFISVFKKVVGALFVLFGTLFFVSLLLVLCNVGTVDGLPVNQFVTSFAGADFPMFWFKTGLALCIGIPLCMIIYKGMKLVLGIKFTNRWLNLGAGSLWLVGLILSLFILMTFLSQFSEETQLKQQINTHFNNKDTLFIKANNNYDKTTTDLEFSMAGEHWIVNETQKPSVWLGKPRVKIITSENDSVSVFIIKSSNGKQKTEASLRAKNINYTATQQDSVLLLNKNFSFLSSDKFRNQEVEVLIKLPKNKIIFIDKSVRYLLYDVENTNGIYDDEMGGKHWKMTENGLTCLDCPAQIEEEKININKEIIINDSAAKVKINKHKIEVHSKDADVKISVDGIDVHSKEETK